MTIGEGGSMDDREVAPVTHTRQVTIDALCEHFAHDILSIEEFERRVELAHAAQSPDELKQLLRDLPGGDPPDATAVQAPPAPEYSVTSAGNVKDRGFVVAVLGGSTRKGRWSPARKNYALAVCGGAQIDFREAVMGPGVTDLQVFAMWGGVEIIVPPGLNVESHGIAIIGGFEHVGDGVHPPDPHAPTLRITGAACMGGVDVSVRYPGETARDARRRRKLQSKERRRLTRGE